MIKLQNLKIHQETYNDAHDRRKAKYVFTVHTDKWPKIIFTDTKETGKPQTKQFSLVTF